MMVLYPMARRFIVSSSKMGFMRKVLPVQASIAETRYVSIRKSYANEGFAFIWLGKAQGRRLRLVILALVLCDTAERFESRLAID
jgi:hypothetical protein